MPGGEGNLQRATKGMALALKSRASLYLASPLYSADDTQKWKNAAQAAYDLISQAGTLGYSLDPKYSNLYGATNNQSKEVIMCRPTEQVQVLSLQTSRWELLKALLPLVRQKTW